LCNLFRPFIEHAQRREEACLLEDPVGDGELARSDIFHSDPFEEDTPKPIIRVTKDFTYSDEGDWYCWAFGGNEERYGAYITEFNNTLAREEAEHRAAGLIPLADDKPVFTEARRSEIMQWLFHDQV
jgi:hypothetical protein